MEKKATRSPTTACHFLRIVLALAVALIVMSKAWLGHESDDKAEPLNLYWGLFTL